MRLAWDSTSRLFEIDCAYCAGTGATRANPRMFVDPDWCSKCGGAGDAFLDPLPLVHNLVFVGALTLSYALGVGYGCAPLDRLGSTWAPNASGIPTPS